MKPLICIAGTDLKRGIAKDNKLPWKLRSEMMFYEKITANVSEPGRQNVVVMGRKTWESMPASWKPIPDMINIILSRTLTEAPEGVIIKPNLSEAMKTMNEQPLVDKIDKIFIGGGAGVYEEAIKSGHCNKIYIVHIMKDFECDTFFPEFDETLYKSVSDPDVPEGIKEEDGIQFEFRLYERQKQAAKI